MLTSPARKYRPRKSYETRTGANTRAAAILAKAVVEKPKFFEDADGNIVRAWQSSEMSSYSNADLANALRNRVAVEPGEMLGTVPPSAIKYCVTKGWLVPNEAKTLYAVTFKAACDLDLPVRFKGGANHGRRIPFLKTTAAKG
jgi:hypothetical protein